MCAGVCVSVVCGVVVCNCLDKAEANGGILWISGSSPNKNTRPRKTLQKPKGKPVALKQRQRFSSCPPFFFSFLLVLLLVVSRVSLISSLSRSSFLLLKEGGEVACVACLLHVTWFFVLVGFVVVSFVAEKKRSAVSSYKMSVFMHVCFHTLRRPSPL